MPFELWDYQLLAADGVPENFYLSPDFIVGGYSMLSRRAIEAKRVVVQAGGTLKGVVYKYADGQAAEFVEPEARADGAVGVSEGVHRPRPRFGHVLQLEDEAIARATGRRNADRPHLMHLVDPSRRLAHARRLSREGLDAIFYEGAVSAEEMPPDHVLHRILSFFRVMEHGYPAVAGAPPVMRWKPRMCIDSATWASEDRDIACLSLRGRMDQRGVDAGDVMGEAYPEPGSAWDRSDVTALGEDGAWNGMNGPEGAAIRQCACGLLHVGGSASIDLPIAAAAAGHMVALNVAGTAIEDLRRVIEAGRTGEGGRS